MKMDRMVWGKRAVFLLSGIIGLGLLLPTHSEAKKPRDLGQACYEKAARLQAKADKGNRNAVRQYNQALDAYLCAAKNGHARSAYLAVILSESGQSKGLPEETKKALMAQAVDAGVTDAIGASIEYDCNKRSKCLHPEKSEATLVKLIQEGYAKDYAYYLATLLEEGKLGEKNIARAYKCYELGSRYGDNFAETGKRLLERQYEAAELETDEICVEGVKK